VATPQHTSLEPVNHRPLPTGVHGATGGGGDGDGGGGEVHVTLHMSR